MIFLSKMIFSVKAFYEEVKNMQKLKRIEKQVLDSKSCKNSARNTTK